MTRIGAIHFDPHVRYTKITVGVKMDLHRITEQEMNLITPREVVVFVENMEEVSVTKIIIQ